MVIEIQSKDRQIFRVGERDYSVSFPLPIVAELETTLNRAMRSVSDWLRIQTKEVPAILEAGFRHYHPNESKTAADAICEALDPEGIESVIDGLCAAACPRAMARIQAEMDKARERTKKGLTAFPNAPGADAL